MPNYHPKKISYNLCGSLLGKVRFIEFIEFPISRWLFDTPLVYSVKADAFTIKAEDEQKVWRVLDFHDDIGGRRVSKYDDIKLPNANPGLLNRAPPPHNVNNLNNIFGILKNDTHPK